MMAFTAELKDGIIVCFLRKASTIASALSEKTIVCFFILTNKHKVIFSIKSYRWFSCLFSRRLCPTVYTFLRIQSHIPGRVASADITCSRFTSLTAMIMQKLMVKHNRPTLLTHIGAVVDPGLFMRIFEHLFTAVLADDAGYVFRVRYDTSTSATLV